MCHIILGDQKYSQNTIFKFRYAFKKKKKKKQSIETLKYPDIPKSFSLCVYM